MKLHRIYVLYLKKLLNLLQSKHDQIDFHYEKGYRLPIGLRSRTTVSLDCQQLLCYGFKLCTWQVRSTPTLID